MLFECSDGQMWVIKLATNPHQRIQALVGDWIGTCLAIHLKLPTLEPTIVRVEQAAIDTIRDSDVRVWARPCHAFATRYLEETSQILQGQEIVSRWSEDNLARLVVLDTWLDVIDRKRPIGWNFLRNTETNGIIVMDFGMAFSTVFGVPLLGGDPLQIMMPDEFRPFVSPAMLVQGAQDASSISDSMLKELVGSLPETWVSEERRAILLTFLTERKQLLPALFAEAV